MKKKLLFVFFLMIGGILYMYFGYQNQNKKDSIQSNDCEKSDSVYCPNYYTINFVQNLYSEKELINSKVNIIKKGKVIKIFNYKKNNGYYNINYTGLLKTDSIKIEIKNDTYYIYDFKNKYIKYPKHSECELSSCKINNFDVSCIRGEFRILEEYR